MQPNLIFSFSLKGMQGTEKSKVNNKWLRGLVSIETVVLCRWGVETNVWFINGVDHLR